MPIFVGKCWILWFSVLLCIYSVSFATNDLKHDRILFGTLLASNVITFVAQTVEVFTPTLWPVTSLNWTSQLLSIGLASASVGRALTQYEEMGVIGCIAILSAQSLFTASQFAVTIAYLRQKAMEAPIAVAQLAAPPMHRIERSRV